MSEFLSCPWCGAQPEEFSKWEEDGLTHRRFGCNNQNCPVRPFVEVDACGAKNGIERWQKMSTVKKLQSALSDCERDNDKETKRGWPFVEPKAP